MSPRNSGTELFMKYPPGWPRDAQLMSVAPATRLLFLELVALCWEMRSDGRVDAVQLSSCGHGMRGLRTHCGHLMDAGLLHYGQEEDAYYIANPSKWLLARPQDNTNAPPKTTVAKGVSAGQRKQAVPERENSRSRAPARVEKDRETDREEGRTPSGSVRPSSAQAAPRGSGGAAQPAPNPEVPPVPEAGTMSGAEARAAIRAQLNKAKQTVPGSTGRDTKFSKYDPDRPITPINSAMAAGWDAE